MRQTATLSGDKVDWPMPTFAAPAVPKIAGTRKMWGSARLPKGHRSSRTRAVAADCGESAARTRMPASVAHDATRSDNATGTQLAAGGSHGVTT